MSMYVCECEHLDSPLVYGGVRVVHICLFVVLWCVLFCFFICFVVCFVVVLLYFVCLRSVSSMTNVDSVSGLPILDWSFGFMWRLFNLFSCQFYHYLKINLYFYAMRQYKRSMYMMKRKKKHKRDKYWFRCINNLNINKNFWTKQKTIIPPWKLNGRSLNTLAMHRQL
jgi:predicted membrane protein